MNNSIGKKTFVTALIILLFMNIFSYALTQFVPMGEYQRETIEGQERIIPDSYSEIETGRLPFWRALISPITVLASSDALMIIPIIVFLMIIGGSIKILTSIGVIEGIIKSIVDRFKDQRTKLLLVLIMAFMLLGALVGIFEEVILLVPIMVILAIRLGYDTMTGLGISLVAIAFGFSAAITNPFTIGIAQNIAGLPMFSGMGYRILFFVATYSILSVFIIRYANKITLNPMLSPTYSEDQEISSKEVDDVISTRVTKKSLNFFVAVMILLLAIIVLAGFSSIVASLALPIIALLFLVAGFGSGFMSKAENNQVFKMFRNGVLSILPGAILILFASSVKHIISQGMIIDTILYNSAIVISEMSPFSALLALFALILFLNFFIGSASAKAFLVMPIIAPLAELTGISRQLSVLAFQFGDGFSNIIYPTNAVLLIALGITSMSYVKWFRWIIKLQILMLIVSIAFLAGGLIIGY